MTSRMMMQRDCRLLQMTAQICQLMMHPKQKPKMIKQSLLIHRQLLIQWLCKQARPNSRGMIPKHQNILH